MQIYQTSCVFPHGGQMVNNQTISLGSNICYLLAILKSSDSWWVSRRGDGCGGWRDKIWLWNIVFFLWIYCTGARLPSICASLRTHAQMTRRKRQEGSRLALSGGSHTWLRQDNVTGGVKTAKIKTEAPSGSTKSELTQQFRTREHYFAFNELRLSWLHLNWRGESSLHHVVLCTSPFFVPHVLKTWSRCISCPEGSCCNLHLHWGGCVWSLHHSFNTLLQPTWEHSVITELPTSHPFVLTDLQ